MVELVRRWGEIYKKAAKEGHRLLVTEGLFDKIPQEEKYFPGQRVISRDSYLALTVLGEFGDKLRVRYKEDTRFVTKNVFKVDVRLDDKYIEALNRINQSEVFYAEDPSDPCFSLN